MKTTHKNLIAAAMATVLIATVATGLSIAHEREKTGLGYSHDAGRDHERHGRRHPHRYAEHGHHGHQRSDGRSARMMENFDRNGDGKLTQEEIDQSRLERFKEFDGNNDERLSLEEYSALWLQARYSRMVDRFQHLDENGDAVVTAEEFQAPFAGLAKKLDRDGDAEHGDEELRRR